MTTVNESLPVGTRLGELEVKHELGSGGFGITYLAMDLALQRSVAIKEYLPREWGARAVDGTVGPRSAAASDDYRWGLTRFIGEARALAKLNHSQIVRVHRVMEARGTAYLVMEYVEGQSLAERLAEKGPMSEDQVKPMLRALAEGLAAVHEAGLLHRDIKPANVMLRQDRSPVLIDFGAARHQMGEHSQTLTAVLTPGYAPVEQYSNAIRQGPWTDIYALGAVAYAALTGRAPKDAIERVYEDQLQPVEQAAPAPVSDRLAAAVGSALMVNARSRPQDLATWRVILDGRTRQPAAATPPAGEPASSQSVGAEPSREELVRGKSGGSHSFPRARRRPSGAIARLAADKRKPVPSGRPSPLGPDPVVGSSLDKVGGRGRQMMGVGAGLIAFAVLIALGGVFEWPGGPASSGVVTDFGADSGTKGLEGTEMLDDDDGELPPEQSESSIVAVVAPPMATAVTILPDRFELASLGASRELVATVLDENGQAMPATLSWSTADTAVATVDRQGRVTATGFGSTTLTATFGSVSGTSGVAVPQRATVVTVTPDRLTLSPPGTTQQASASVRDQSGQVMQDAPLSWTTADDAVATVDGDGLVTATGGGNTELTATSGSASDTSSVVVMEAPSAVTAATDPSPRGSVFQDCPICPQMIVVASGSFVMGSPSTEAGRQYTEGPQQHVTFEAPFAVGVYEVSFEEWVACAREGGCGRLIPNDQGWGQGNRPVINVSWDDTRAYIGWLSEKTGKPYRLLSEAEWEYVARAGTEAPQYWGDVPEDQCGYANGFDVSGSEHEQYGVEFDWAFASCRDGYADSAPVGSFGPNPFGLYDILGNVSEWTMDCWNENHKDEPGNGQAREDGVCDTRVLRGGSWRNGPASLRAASRIASDRGFKSYNLGFRVALTIQ